MSRVQLSGSGRRGARGDHRGQLQPGGLRRTVAPRALGGAGRPRGPGGDRDRGLLGDRSGGRARAGPARRDGVDGRPRQAPDRGRRAPGPRPRGRRCGRAGGARRDRRRRPCARSPRGSTAAHERLDVLVHAAGALYPTYRSAPDGGELTVATAVLAPFRLTWLLGPLLRRSGEANIVTVSSGGMYTQRFDLDRLEMPPDRYRGTTAYARAKRAQVVLSHEWARRWGPDGVASYASHPGLGRHAGPGQRAAPLRPARAAAADPGAGGRHGGLAGGRRGPRAEHVRPVDRGVLPRPAPAWRAPSALDGPRPHRDRGPGAVGLVRVPHR